MHERDPNRDHKIMTIGYNVQYKDDLLDMNGA